MKRMIAFILSLVMMLSALAMGLAGEVSAAEDVEFVVPKVVPAKGIEDFVGKWFISHVVYEDGKVLSREEMIEEDGLQDSSQDGEADMAMHTLRRETRWMRQTTDVPPSWRVMPLSSSLPGTCSTATSKYGLRRTGRSKT